MDTNTCICLGFHGDGVPYAKGTHKQVSAEVHGSAQARQVPAIVNALSMLHTVM